jgi:HAD superfamily hydrolase (TIGR01509 family)
MNNIEWIFFDMGGVILDDSEPEIMRQQLALNVAKKYMPTVTMTDVKEAWMIASGTPGSMRIVALRELCKSLPNLEEIVSEYKELCQIDYHSLCKVRPEAKEVVSQLSQRYQLGLMANQGAKAISHLVDSGLLEFFSYQKMSHHVGLEKPDPEFFKSILNATKAQPDKSVIIDDNWFRGCLPARKEGMKTILYKRDIIPSPDDANPNWQINSLTELLKIF